MCEATQCGLPVAYRDGYRDSFGIKRVAGRATYCTRPATVRREGTRAVCEYHATVLGPKRSQAEPGRENTVGTAYRTICECLASGPEPDPCEYTSERAYQDEHDRWEAAWGQAVGEHHAYCCQEQRKAGGVDRCLVGRDATCPVLAESREMWRLAPR